MDRLDVVLSSSPSACLLGNGILRSPRGKPGRFHVEDFLLLYHCCDTSVHVSYRAHRRTQPDRTHLLARQIHKRMDG